jgi:uncharacterized membrane protein YbhN (UPF0104 family)
MQPPMSAGGQESLPRASLESARQESTGSKNIRILLAVLKIFAGLAFLILAVRGINYHTLISGIGTAKLSWLLLAIVSILFGLGLKLWRWSTLLKNYRLSVHPSRLFSAYFIGQAANIVLPFRGGELVRLGYFTEDKKILPQAASTIVVEKYLDLLALTAACILVSVKISIDNILNLRGFLLPITIFVSILLFAAILFGPATWQKFRDKKFLPDRLTPWIDRWVQASLWLRDGRLILPVMLQTMLIWIVMWLTNLLLFHSMGMSLGGTAGGLVLVLVYVGLLPALMPGNIGPFYYFASLALLPFGTIQEQAVMFAVVLHAIVTLPPLLGGAIGLFIRSPHPYSA